MTAGRPRRARKIDANQPAVVDKLRKQGFSVLVVNGDVDLVVGWGGASLLVEVKNPAERGKPNARQERLFEDFKGAYLVAESAEDVMDWFSQNVVEAAWKRTNRK